MKEEIWTEIKGYPEYEISSLGRVRSLRCGKVYILKTTLQYTGYVHINIRLKGDLQPKGYRLHRLVASHFIPNPENKKTVNHIDGNKLNNAAYNLEWATQSENNKHAFKTGLRSHKGENGPAAKLTNERADTIRLIYNSGHFKQKELAEQFGVTQSRISEIVRNKSYATIY